MKFSRFLIFVGMTFLVTAYLVGVVTVLNAWVPDHWAVQIVYVAVAGIAWALPIRAWMKRRIRKAQEAAED